MQSPTPQPPTHSTRSELWRILGLLLILLPLRLAYFNHPQPCHPDELSFMAAAEQGFTSDYPVHSPGYVGWVLLGRLNHLMGMQPYTAFQVWSLIASILAPLVMFVLLLLAAGVLGLLVRRLLRARRARQSPA